MPEPTLLLVYHADSGRWNALWDIAHKVISPGSYSCTLCALTHGALSERRAWKDFRERHPNRLEILHRDEFHRRHPQVEAATPCALARQADGTWLTAMDPADIHGCAGVEDLIERLARLLAQAA